MYCMDNATQFEQISLQAVTLSPAVTAITLLGKLMSQATGHSSDTAPQDSQGRLGGPALPQQSAVC